MRIIIVLFLAAIAYGKPAEVKNPMINEGFFGGDIAGIDPNLDKGAVPKDSQLWPNGVVPYVVDPSLYYTSELIQESMRRIEETSCVRFVQRTNERNYIRIYSGNGCWSYMGMLNNGEQKVSIGKGCENKGIIVHELMHAIGFAHEQNRSDRDEYITINWENVKPEFYSALQKFRPEQNRLLTAFDYNSLMLYGDEAFTKQAGLKTMVAKKGHFFYGNLPKPDLTPIDIQRVNLLYRCPQN